MVPEYSNKKALILQLADRGIHEKNGKIAFGQ
jgi:hypothetical protein